MHWHRFSIADGGIAGKVSQRLELVFSHYLAFRPGPAEAGIFTRCNADGSTDFFFSPAAMLIAGPLARANRATCWDRPSRRSGVTLLIGDRTAYQCLAP